MASNICRETELVGEPSWDEILAEPIIQLIMKRDGVDASDMRGTLDRVRSSYALDAVLQ